MKMAKASEADLRTAEVLIAMLQSIEGGQFPPIGLDEDGDMVWPEREDADWFDRDDDEACGVALRRILAFLDDRPGGALQRVVFGMRTLMDNDVCDPASDTLAWHPDLVPAIEARKSEVAR